MYTNSVYLKDKPGGELKEFPLHKPRDDIVEQLPFVKKRFLTYKNLRMQPLINYLLQRN